MELQRLLFCGREKSSQKRSSKIKVLKEFLNPQSLTGRWLPPFLWALVIFSLSSIKQVSASEFFTLDFIIKKTAHVSEYAILYLLLFRATKQNFRKSYIITVIYAITDEFHQSFVPGRTMAWFDFAFDVTGANIASYALWKLLQILKKKPKK